MVNCMIVDNDPFAVRKLAEILEMISPGQRICSFGEPETALEYGAKSQVDIAFLETRLGGMNGLLLAVRLRELQPKIQVILSPADRSMRWTHFASTRQDTCSSRFSRRMCGASFPFCMEKREAASG